MIANGCTTKRFRFIGHELRDTLTWSEVAWHVIHGIPAPEIYTPKVHIFVKWLAGCLQLHFGPV